MPQLPTRRNAPGRPPRPSLALPLALALFVACDASPARAPDSPSDDGASVDLAVDDAPTTAASASDEQWLRELGRTPAFDEETRERLIRLAQSADPAIREASVPALGRASEWNHASGAQLNSMTEDAVFAVAAAAAEEIVRRYPITPPTDALICGWVRSDDPEKRAAGLEIIPLVRAPDLRTWRVIEEIALSDAPVKTRVSALVAIGEHRHRSPAVREAILRGLASPDDFLRSMALLTARWCEIADPELMRVAQAMSENDVDEDVRDEARAYLLSCDGDAEPLEEDD